MRKATTRSPAPPRGDAVIERRTTFWLPVVLAAIAGCASVGPRTADDYERGDATEPKFRNDSALCQRQAEADQRTLGQLGPMDPMQSTFNRMYDACMRASGYARKTPQ